MDAQRFFAVALPELANRHAAAYSALRGTIVFAVSEAGAWTVHLGNRDQPVTDGACAQPDLSLYFSSEAFARLLAGQLDFDQAIEKRAVGYEGDLMLLEKLGYLISAGRDADGVQVDQVAMSFKRV